VSDGRQRKNPKSMTQPSLTFLRSASYISEQRKQTMVFLRFSSKESLFLGLELAGFSVVILSGTTKRK
jgi:hypothetical protein